VVDVMLGPIVVGVMKLANGALGNLVAEWDQMLAEMDMVRFASTTAVKF
jgi:hypothetical protein